MHREGQFALKMSDMPGNVLDDLAYKLWALQQPDRKALFEEFVEHNERRN